MAEEAKEQLTGTQEMDKTPNSESTANSWCKLTSLNTQYGHIMVVADKHTFGRLDANNTAIHDKRLSGMHCSLYREKKENGEYGFFVHDMSSNGTYVNDMKIGKNEKKEIQNGDTVQLLSAKLVPPQDVIAYVFSLTGATQGKRKSSKDKTESEQKRQKIDDALSDEMKCCICMDMIYQAVTVMPCLHNFCGGCYSLWMKKSKECPQCRKQVMEVKKNPTLNNMIEKFAEAHPETKKSKEELEELTKNNVINSDVIRVSEEEKKVGRKKQAKAKSRRVYQQDDESDSDFDSDGSANAPIIPTSTLFSGSTGILCDACKRSIMASETPEKCTLCNFQQHTACRPRGRKILAIAAHNIQGIPVDCFSNNKEEQKIVSTYIATKSIKMTELYSKLTNDMEANGWTVKDSMSDK